MRGHTHALSGAAAWLLFTSSSSFAYFGGEHGSDVVLAGTIVCAGAAMAPDWDHHNGTIAHSLPPVTKWIAGGVEAVSGGHRHGTHSFLGVLVAWALTMGAAQWVTTIQGREVAIGGAIVAALMTAFAAKVFGLARNVARSTGRGSVVSGILRSAVGPWVLAIASAATMTWFMDYQWTWPPTAVALGCFVHIIGDFITPQGVWWLWPWKPRPPQWLRDRFPAVRVFWLNNGRMRLPILGTVELKKRSGIAVLFNRESLLATFLTIYVLYLVAREFAVMAGVTTWP